MNFRIDRINSEMQKSISAIIRRLKDPRITSMVSVIEVNTAKDLKTAKVYVSCYGGDTEQTFEAIKRCSGHIRKELSDEFKELRCVPQLNFILDISMDYSEKINAILTEIKKDESDKKN